MRASSFTGGIWAALGPMFAPAASLRTQGDAPGVMDQHTIRPAQPAKPGCYIWMPSGCPQHAGANDAKYMEAWRPDAWHGWDMQGVDLSSFNDAMKLTCETSRKETMSGFCGAHDVQMLWVPHRSGQGAGTPAGCYTWLPSGCPKQGKPNPVPWSPDQWPGWRGLDARQAVKKCEAELKAGNDAKCGVGDSVAKYIQDRSARPTSPGCHVWLPSGCPMRGPSIVLTGWRPGEWHRWSDGQPENPAVPPRAVCEQGNRQKVNAWCGVQDAMAVFIAGPPQKPQQPGCYVWTPSGCPMQPSFDASAAWRRDPWLDMGGAGGRPPRQACELDRQSMLATLCGAQDVTMFFVDQAGGNTAPGAPPAPFQGPPPGAQGAVGGQMPGPPRALAGAAPWQAPPPGSQQASGPGFPGVAAPQGAPMGAPWARAPAPTAPGAPVPMPGAAAGMQAPMPGGPGAQMQVPFAAGAQMPMPAAAGQQAQGGPYMGGPPRPMGGGGPPPPGAWPR